MDDELIPRHPSWLYTQSSYSRIVLYYVLVTSLPLLFFLVDSAARRRAGRRADISKPVYVNDIVTHGASSRLSLSLWIYIECLAVFMYTQQRATHKKETYLSPRVLDGRKPRENVAGSISFASLSSFSSNRKTDRRVGREMETSSS